MKTNPILILALLAGSLGPCAVAATAASSKPFDGYIVAESVDAVAKPAHPSTGSPVAYLAYDSGLIEGGDSIAGDSQPTPATVAQAFRAALDAEGFVPATAATPPSVVLIYSWGSIRHSSTEPNIPFRIRANLRARLALVSTQHTIDAAEDMFRGPRIDFVRPDVRDGLQLAGDAHYFFIVSAYDYAGLTRGVATPLWSTRISAFENSGSMAEVVPALAASCGPYLAQNLPELEQKDLPRYAGSSAEAGSAAPFAVSPELSSHLEAAFLKELVTWENNVAAGLRDPAFTPRPGGRLAAN